MLLHGSRRYGSKNVGVFILVTFIIVTILESMSILTGFPLGHYYYTSLLGPKLALVPAFVYISYIALGYLAWVFSSILVGEVRRGSTVFTTIAVPIVATLVMATWDLSADPYASTLKHAWIWTQGGAYFGVPYSNFIGWPFTVYLFFQLFALYMRKTGQEDLARRLPTTHYLQAILVYLWTGVGFVLVYLSRPANTLVTDAVGRVWQTGAIYEATAITAILTMIPVSILSIAVLFRDQERQKAVSLFLSEA